ncbi:MAG: TolC family protein [Bacteroidales bacterium]
MKRFVFLIFVFCFVAKVSLQAQIDSIVVSSDKTLSGVLLPPINVLFESCRTTSRIAYYESRTREERHDLKSLKREWISYIRLVGGYQYGQFWTNSLDSQVSSPIIQNSRDNKSYYNAGFSVSLPLDQIVDRQNRIGKQKELIKQTEIEIQRYWEEQKMLISESYTEASRCLQLVRVRSEALNLAEAQYRSALNDFAQSTINLSDLSKLKNIHSDALGDYELIMAQLKNALIRLEVLSGYKILK